MSATLEQRTLKLSIIATLFVSSLGITFGLLAGSRSIMFDGVFSAIDAAMSGLALMVARLVVREASQRFQHGFWHLEPMVAALNGSVLVLLCLYAFLNAIQALLDGGRELAFDVAIIYAVVVVVLCFAMYFYEERVNKRVDSELLRIDIQGWLMAGLITTALLIAFAIALVLERTAYAELTPYVDSVLLMVLTACFLPVPVGIVRRALREVLLVTPDELDQQVHTAMAPVMTEWNDALLAYNSHVVKSGRGRFIEIHILTRPDFGKQRGVAEMDEIRERIAAALPIPAERRWFTVAFTAQERWA